VKYRQLRQELVKVVYSQLQLDLSGHAQEIKVFTVYSDLGILKASALGILRAEAGRQLQPACSAQYQAYSLKLAMTLK
jgi:hypothetical protein